MYACMYACMYVCVYVCMRVRMCVCMYACTYVCMYVCMYVCVYVCMYVYGENNRPNVLRILCSVDIVFCGYCALWILCSVDIVFCGYCVLWILCSVDIVFCGYCVLWIIPKGKLKKEVITIMQVNISLLAFYRKVTVPRTDVMTVTINHLLVSKCTKTSLAQQI